MAGSLAITESVLDHGRPQVRDARAHGITGIEVSAGAFNTEMHRLVERAGFVRKVLRFELPQTTSLN